MRVQMAILTDLVLLSCALHGLGVVEEIAVSIAMCAPSIWSCWEVLMGQCVLVFSAWRVGTRVCFHPSYDEKESDHQAVESPHHDAVGTLNLEHHIRAQATLQIQFC